MAHSADRGEENLKILCAAMRIINPTLGDAAATKIRSASSFDGNEIRLGAGSVGSLVHLIAYLPANIT